MNISDIGAQYLNSAYVPLSSHNPTASGLQSGTGFDEILKRAQEAAKQPEAGKQTETNGRPDTVSAPRASKMAPVDKNSQLYELCMELETLLIKNLIKGMRSTVQKSKLIDTGFAGEIYEDMLYDEYTKTYARNANLGFAEMAYRDLTRGQ